MFQKMKNNPAKEPSNEADMNKFGQKDPDKIIGKSSRRRDPAEFSGTFWNTFLVYKFCNSLDILIGLQRNTLYSKSNQRATGFLRQK